MNPLNLFTKRPMVGILWTVLFGIFCNSLLLPEDWWALSIITLSTLSVLFLISSFIYFPQHLLLKTIVSFISFFVLFGYYSASQSDHVLPDIPAVPVTIHGTLTYSDRKDDLKIVSVFKVKEIVVNDYTEKVEFSIYIYSDSTTLQLWKEGYGYSISGVIMPFPKPPNFTDIDYGKILKLRQDIYGFLTINNITSVNYYSEFNSTFNQSIGNIRFYIEKQITTYISGKISQGFARGMILGNRSWLDPEVLNSFGITGTMHILSVSGLHVGFITMLIFIPLIRLRIWFPKHGEIIRVIFTFSILLFYGTITGWPVSITRSVTMAGIFLFSLLLASKRDVWTSFSLAGFLILLWNPLQLFQPDFLLSFSAVGGIIFLTRNLTFPNLPTVLKYTVDGILISYAAWLVTAPISVYFFQSLPLVGSLSNLFVIPLSALILIYSVLTILASFFSATIAGFFGNSVDFFTDTLTYLVNWVALLPYSGIKTTIEQHTFLLIFSAGILFFLTIIFRGKRFHLFATWILIPTFLIISITSIRYENTIISFLNVGQGDGIFIRSNNKTLLIDAGPPSHEKYSNTRLIESKLKEKGSPELDYFILSHPHLDHYGGLNQAHTKIKINHIILGDTSFSSNMFHQFIENYKQTGSILVFVKDTLSILIGEQAKVYLINAGLKEKNLNNNSLFMRFQHQDFSVLMMGDSESNLESHFSQLIPDQLFHSTIFKLSHHGSKTSSSDIIFKKQRTQIAIVQVAERNRYRLPVPAIIEKWRQLGIPVLLNSESGEIRIRLNEENKYLVELSGIN